MKTYELKVAGLTRNLPIFPISDTVSIAAFILLGDVELTVACAEELLKKIPKCDVIFTSEAKSISLAYEMAKMANIPYVVARKSQKVYMANCIEASVRSITTQSDQKLYVGEDDAKAISGKNVLILDDVISLGDTLRALEELVTTAGGKIVGKAAVLAEGDAAERDDIIFLEKLPLIFNN